jgi:hypothetical protein
LKATFQILALEALVRVPFQTPVKLSIDEWREVSSDFAVEHAHSARAEARRTRRVAA